MTDNYIVLDTETTGLNPARDKVLEIGAARIEQGRVVETFETLIDTGVPIPERITELTGITDAMQAEGRICVSITGLIRGIPTEPLMMHWQHMNCCRGCGRNSERKNRMHLLQDRCSTVQKSRVRLRIHKKDT